MNQALIEALRSYTQADMDGVFVRVSRQACDEAAHYLEQMIWQPIETAPMDGSHIIIYRPHIHFVGYHSDSGWRHNAPGLDAISPAPTHWMRLPKSHINP